MLDPANDQDMRNAVAPIDSDLAQYAREIPKVELHLHLTGSIRADTMIELAGRDDVPLPSSDPDALFDYDNLPDFLRVLGLAGRVMQRRSDFERVTYESLADGVAAANLRYREMFINPTEHMRHGARYRDIVDGILDGARQAERDFGVRCRLIPSIYRGDDRAQINEMMDAVLSYRPEAVIGIGMDAEEVSPLTQFAPHYRRASEAGLRLTGHCAEYGSPDNLEVALDELGLERIDHGYYVLDRPDLVLRCRDEGIHFTTTPNSVAQVYGWRDMSRHPIVDLLDAGLSVSLGSDDPTMFRTELGKEYIDMCGANGYGRAFIDRVVLAGIEGSWMDAVEKRAMRTEVEEFIRTFPAPTSPPSDRWTPDKAA